MFRSTQTNQSVCRCHLKFINIIIQDIISITRLDNAMHIEDSLIIECKYVCLCLPEVLSFHCFLSLSLFLSTIPCISIWFFVHIQIGPHFVFYAANQIFHRFHLFSIIQLQEHAYCFYCKKKNMTSPGMSKFMYAFDVFVFIFI